jgi:hypothetical protein
MKDFTAQILIELLNSAKSRDYLFYKFSDLAGKKNALSKTIILRHDIDAMPLNALSMAKIEKKVGVTSSYFFKVHPRIFVPDLVIQIASCNHEIGYHYEDLARNHGNYSRAISDFERNLDTLRKVVPINTICADGNPLSKHNNLWLWEKYDYKRYGINCEVYLDIDYNETAYFTDTGRCWDGEKYNVWDHVKSNQFWPRYHTTYNIIQAVADNSFPLKCVINTHPQRWHNNMYDWSKELIMQNIKNQMKFLLMKMSS